MNKYPAIEIDLEKLKYNIKQIMIRCNDKGIDVAGVVKGFTGIPEAAEMFEAAGCKYIASSRLEQLEDIRERGVQTPFMLIRVPMLSEVESVIALTDISLNSELEVLWALNKEAGKQDKKHKVILMVDLGDLREGYWDQGELLQVAVEVENKMANLELAGVGTNLGCYGSIAATPEKLNELVACGEAIEAKIGRELEFIAGGGTTSLPRVLENNMPNRVNLLRIGEGIILARDLQELWGLDMSFMHKDVFTLKAEVIEIKDKPSYPVGEIMFDAFGNRPTYMDKGIRRKLLLGMGRVDYAFTDKIYPRDEGVEILGASSDHTILDVTDAKRNFRIGDILEFDICYATLVFTTNSPNVKKQFKGNQQG